MNQKKIKKEKMDRWKEIEAKLQVADIILARRKKFFSQMIRKATGSYWSHVMIVFSVADKKINFKNNDGQRRQRCLCLCRAVFLK